MCGRGTSEIEGRLAAMAGAIAMPAQDKSILPRDVLLPGTVGVKVDCSGVRADVAQGVFDTFGGGCYAP